MKVRSLNILDELEVAVIITWAMNVDWNAMACEIRQKRFRQSSGKEEKIYESVQKENIK